TTDVHGFVEHGDEGPKSGGWLRVAAALRSERQAAGAENTLLIDCGDAVTGSLSAALTRGKIGIAMLRELDYDVWVPGNHELDYGARRLRQFCKTLSDQTLCGNMVLHPDSKDAYSAPAWRLFKRAGCRIAVIGANSAFLDNWLWGRDRRDFKIEPAVDMLRRILPTIHAHRPDVIILAAHQGWYPVGKDSRSVNEIETIATRFPEIDLILGGHTHRERAGIPLNPGTWHVQAGAHANGYARIRMKVDTENQRVLDVESAFIPVRGRPPDKQCQKAVAPFLAQSRTALETPVGIAKSAVRADGRAGFGSATAELLCRAIAESANADVVIHGKLSQYSLAPGPITERDLFGLVPYENGIGAALLTRAELQTILTEQRDQHDSYAYCGVWGARLRWLENGGVSEVRVEADGVIGADGQRRYRTAFNSYTLASGGGRFPELRRITRKPQAQLIECEQETRDALRQYIRAHSPITITPEPWIQR
ncbi:MAG: bifunctional metallophosphatase/5'-nucleotidase, partial [Verrucomicrobiota bacterium]